MKTEIIKIPNTVNYLSEAINELPKNALFDKGKVGCGGTTLAIENSQPYIVCVPFVSLIENKLTQYPNSRFKGEILGVYEGVTVENIKDYIQRVDIPKIIVTYDSLPKVVKAVNPLDFNLLVDELHLLFTQYSFRRNAAIGVLKNYNKFKNFCFMTATQLEEEFMLTELKDIARVKAEWDRNLIVNIQSVKCKNGVDSTIAQIVREFLNGDIDGNAYFFINSVKFIEKIVKECKLNEDNTRVIYSENNKTVLSIPNGKTIDKPKKINFLTSAVFEGSDVYDENGYTFIVSDGSNNHTITDISTTFQQIAGRIRNSKHIGNIYHIFTQTRYSEVTYDEFKEISDRLVKETKYDINQYNNLEESARNRIKELDVDISYLFKEDGYFYFDENKVKVDLWQYKINRSVYSIRVNLIEEYKKYGYSVDSFNDESLRIKPMDKTDNVAFKDLMPLIRAELDNKYALSFPIYDAACAKYSWLQEAVEKLGFENMATLKYVQKSIKNELTKSSDKNLNNKVLILINREINLSNGDFISNAEIKEKIQNVYDSLGIKKNAKATDIENWFEVKESNKRIGIDRIKGFNIIRSKVVFK